MIRKIPVLIVNRKRTTWLAALPLALLAACGGGPSGTGVSSTALSELASEVPIAGQFLADCTDDGLAIIQDFVGTLPIPEAPLGAPAIGDVLLLGDPDAIPVIGGLGMPALPGGALLPTDLASVLAMIPSTGIPTDLPVVGLVPVTCDDVPLPLDSLPDPTDALALIPIVDPEAGPVALVLGVVGRPLPDATAIDEVALPDFETLLPEPLGSTVGMLTSLLNLLPL